MKAMFDLFKKKKLENRGYNFYDILSILEATRYRGEEKPVEIVDSGDEAQKKLEYYREIGFNCAKEAKELEKSISTKTSIRMNNLIEKGKIEYYNLLSREFGNTLYLIDTSTFETVLKRIGRFGISRLENYTGSLKNADLKKLWKIKNGIEYTKYNSVVAECDFIWSEIDKSRSDLYKYRNYLDPDRKDEHRTNMIYPRLDKERNVMEGVVFFAVTSPGLLRDYTEEPKLSFYKSSLPVTMIIMYTSFGVLVCDLWEEE